MKKRKGPSVHILVLLLAPWLILIDSAEIFCGDIIDNTNWEQAEGLLPDSVLNWVKNGQLVLDVGQLNYDPAAYLPQHVLDSLQTNAGRHEIDETGWIVDVKTAKPARHIVGFPFPKIDLEAQQAGEKIVSNEVYTWNVHGHLRLVFQMKWLHPSSGLEREIDIHGQVAVLQGWPGIKALPNKALVEKYQIVLVAAPVDIKGTAVMTWRYMSPDKQDSTFGYIPSIRRVRQMSPANRSDAFVGSDNCLDDANVYDGKVQAFAWKFVGKQEAIVPFLDENPQPIEQNRTGEWCTTYRQKYVINGFEKEGWQGAAWAPTNLLWVRRPTYVIEMRAKDPYYNYGRQYMWVDAETFSGYYKVIHDRADSYWKTMLTAFSGYVGTGGEMRLTTVAHSLMVDDRTRHATAIEGASRRNTMTYFADVNQRDFTLAGFQKFCR
jgi:hypothetical protein